MLVFTMGMERLPLIVLISQLFSCDEQQTLLYCLYITLLHCMLVRKNMGSEVTIVCVLLSVQARHVVIYLYHLRDPLLILQVGLKSCVWPRRKRWYRSFLRTRLQHTGTKICCQVKSMILGFPNI